MNNKKLNLIVLFGGQSTEHEISILSARNVFNALDKNKYDINSIYITQEGAWFLLNGKDWIREHPQTLMSAGKGQKVFLAPGQIDKPIVFSQDVNQGLSVDCIIPMLHGTLGEDGAPQGLLDMMQIPYIGSKTLSSTLCMNKQITKQLLRAAGIKVADFIVITSKNRDQFQFQQLVQYLGATLFVKPANLGSSVGMGKANSEIEFERVLNMAFQYSDVILVEPFIKGREIECAVLGNSYAESTAPGEIIPHDEFYTYSAKYLVPEGEGATLITPAVMSSELIDQFKEIAIQAYDVLQCQGMARIDFFLTKEDDIILNEVNTIPGFTNISMYPRLWMHSGMDGMNLLDQLINLALEDYQHQQSLVRVYSDQTGKTE